MQGDVTALVSDSGEIVMTYTYDAWGAVSFGASSMQNMQLAVSLYNVNPFTYRGYCYDDDIGMYYLQSRYYDPQICRFINADSTDYLGATGTKTSNYTATQWQGVFSHEMGHALGYNSHHIVAGRSIMVINCDTYFYWGLTAPTAIDLQHLSLVY